jgi:hypothetical protein
MSRTGIEHGTQHQLRFRAFRVPKQGCDAVDCLDAAAGLVRPDGGGRFAIADGASEGGPSSGLWARLLAEDFVRSSDPSRPWPRSLQRVQQRWQNEIARLAPQTDVPWYLSEHDRTTDNAGFATFLGVVLERADTGDPWHWQARAIGDSCLFHTRGDDLVSRFPVNEAMDFDSTPWLVGSRSPIEELAREDRCHVHNSSAQDGDRLWLMTDALAEWFLLRWHVDERPWGQTEPFLDAAATLDSFAQWIDRLRRTGQLKNDDVTLLGVALE